MAQMGVAMAGWRWAAGLVGAAAERQRRARGPRARRNRSARNHLLFDPALALRPSSAGHPARNRRGQIGLASPAAGDNNEAGRVSPTGAIVPRAAPRPSSQQAASRFHFHRLGAAATRLRSARRRRRADSAAPSNNRQLLARPTRNCSAGAPSQRCRPVGHHMATMQIGGQLNETGSRSQASGSATNSSRRWPVQASGATAAAAADATRGRRRARSPLCRRRAVGAADAASQPPTGSAPRPPLASVAAAQIGERRPRARAGVGVGARGAAGAGRSPGDWRLATGGRLQPPRV